jgi:hypothetical protein
MKAQSILPILTGLLFGLYACKKSDNIADPGSIVGKWNVVNIEDEGVNHVGKAGDYFLFGSDGSLTIKGSTALQSFSYVVADSAITFTPPPGEEVLSEFSRIKTFSAHSLVLDGPYPITPGGPNDVGSEIVLSR